MLQKSIDHSWIRRINCTHLRYSEHEVPLRHGHLTITELGEFLVLITVEAIINTALILPNSAKQQKVGFHFDWHYKNLIIITVAKWNIDNLNLSQFSNNWVEPKLLLRHWITVTVITIMTMIMMAMKIIILIIIMRIMEHSCCYRVQETWID